MHTEASRGYGQDRPRSSERRSAEHRREQLLAAAVELIAEQGLERATTRAITDRAGLALGAFHYVFASKDELLEAVAERLVRASEATMAASARTAAPTVEPEDGLVGDALVVARLRGLLQGAWEATQRSQRLQLARYELMLHGLRDPAKHHIAVQQHEPLVGAVSDTLRGLTAALDDATADELARGVLAALDGLRLQWLVEQDDEAAAARLDRYLDALPAIVAAHHTG